MTIEHCSALDTYETVGVLIRSESRTLKSITSRERPTTASGLIGCDYVEQEQEDLENSSPKGLCGCGLHYDA